MAQPQGQQTINIADLDIPQLSDVKKQLEEVIDVSPELHLRY